MSTLREAAQQALEALDNIDKEFKKHGRQHWPEAVKARNAAPALRAALAEPVQEQPVCDECGKSKRDGWALYCVDCLEPVFAQRKPLTEEEIQQCFKEAGITIKGQHWVNVIRNVERAHGIGGQP